MKAVFDTNVLISALISTGKARLLFDKAIENHIQLVISDEMLAEFGTVIVKPHIAKYICEQDIDDFLYAIEKVAQVIRVKSKFEVVANDPDDDLILRTAFDSEADIIVSGDKHLLSLGAFRRIKILSVDQTLKLLNEEKGAGKK